MQSTCGTSVWTGDDAASASVYAASLLSLYFSPLFGALQGAAIVDAHGGSQDIYAELVGALIPTLGGIVSRKLGMMPRTAPGEISTTVGRAAELRSAMCEARQASGEVGRSSLGRVDCVGSTVCSARHLGVEA